jgi:uncharacterized protein
MERSSRRKAAFSSFIPQSQKKRMLVREPPVGTDDRQPMAALAISHWGFRMAVHPYIGVVQDLLAIAIAVAFPLIDLRAMQRLKQFSSAAARLAVYRRGIVGAWAAVIVVASVVPSNALLIIPRRHADVPWLNSQPLAQAAILTIIALLVTWIFRPSIQCMLQKNIRKMYLSAYQASTIRFLLPVSRQERAWWILLSITAGVCEEVLYRGFLLHYLCGHLAGGPAFGLMSAWLLSSLIFGLGHFYQGRLGMIQTTVAGMVFGMLAILSGNLALPILLHTLLDLRVLLLYNPAEDDPESAAALIRGFNPQAH